MRLKVDRFEIQITSLNGSIDSLVMALQESVRPKRQASNVDDL